MARLQSMRAVVVLAVTIVGTLAGGGFAAATHGTNHVDAKASTTLEALETPDPTPLPGASGSPTNPHGYSLVALAQEPFVTMYTTHLQIFQKLEKCKDSAFPKGCVKSSFRQFGDSYATAQKALKKVSVPANVASWKDQLLSRLGENATAWHSIDFNTITKDELEKQAEVLDEKGYEADEAMHDLVFQLSTQVIGASDGNVLPVSVEATMKKLAAYVKGTGAASSATTGDA